VTLYLQATTTQGFVLAFKVGVPVSDDDLERLAALQSMPNMAGCTWTGRQAIR
jgi:hypothetical protein